MSDPVNHPKHYTAHPSGVECIEIVRHMNFNLGNATKYIWRAGLKDEINQDLKKAIFYLNDELQRIREFGLSKCYGPEGIDADDISRHMPEGIDIAFECIWQVAFEIGTNPYVVLKSAIAEIEKVIEQPKKPCESHQMGKRHTSFGTEYYCIKCGERL